MSSYNHNFELTLRLRDGRSVCAVGIAVVLPNCDCRGESHDHIEELDIESVVQVFESGTVEGPEIEADQYTMNEIEIKAERAVYRELECAA